jgi:magnesium transporter
MESAIRDLRESITVTEEYVNLQLDSSRNRMMRHTLVLSVGTMATSLGGLVIGAFGMNLTTGFETHPWAFWGVAAFVPATMVGIFYGMCASGGEKWMRRGEDWVSGK